MNVNEIVTFDVADISSDFTRPIAETVFKYLKAHNLPHFCGDGEE